MAQDRVHNASARIEEAAGWVDLALAELDREAHVFHTSQERCRQTLQGLLLRLQVLGVHSGDPTRVAEEIQRFEAAFRDTLRVAEEACLAASGRRLSTSGSPGPSLN